MNDSVWITTCASCVAGITQHIKARNALLCGSGFGTGDECRGITVAAEMGINEGAVLTARLPGVPPTATPPLRNTPPPADTLVCLDLSHNWNNNNNAS